MKRIREMRKGNEYRSVHVPQCNVITVVGTDVSVRSRGRPCVADHEACEGLSDVENPISNCYKLPL